MLQNKTTRNAFLVGGVTVLAIVVATVLVTIAIIKPGAPPASLPSTPSQGQTSGQVSPVPVVIVTPGPTPVPQFGAAPIPGNEITLGIYTKPGKPEEMTDGGQIAASFILLASSGRIDEALKLTISSETLVRQAKLLRERYPNAFKKGVEIRSFSAARRPYPGSAVFYDDVYDLDTGNAVRLVDRRTEDDSLNGFGLSKSGLEPWRIYYPEPPKIIPFSGYRYDERTLLTFNSIPTNPKLVVERIAAIYFLAASGRIDEAVIFAPVADREKWRAHFETKSGRLLSRGDAITIMEARQEPKEALYNISLLLNAAIARVCVEVADGNITKLAPC
ncbi:MAG: hypothetical protein HYT49_01200 [Candidatus Wildermuthbacteria bacterium]|nr:hypothetical protein [Candidatus Wildermuthbacteria bacterium]